MAAVVNVTATEASGNGYLQVSPTGRAVIGSSSTLNVDFAGQTLPNAAFAPIGDGGQITVFSTFTTDVLIDVSGYYFVSADAATAGRLVPITPTANPRHAEQHRLHAAGTAAHRRAGTAAHRRAGTAAHRRAGTAAHRRAAPPPTVVPPPAAPVVPVPVAPSPARPGNPGNSKNCPTSELMPKRKRGSTCTTPSTAMSPSSTPTMTASPVKRFRLPLRWQSPPRPSPTVRRQC